MWKAYVHNRTMILYFVGIIRRDGGISRRLCVSMHHSCHPVIKLISKGRRAEFSIPGIIQRRDRCRHIIRHQPNSADGYRHAIRHRPNPAGWSRFPVHRGNQWDIRQLPPPVGFIGPLIAITLGIIGLVLDKYCIGIRVSNEVYKQGSKYCRGRYWELAPSIPSIFRSTNEYRHDILQQPEPAGGYNRTTNNCECIDCSILVFLDCFLSVL